MKEIKLTQGKVALVDDEDYEFLNQWKWYAKKDSHIFYAQSHIGTKRKEQKSITMHRLIMNVSAGIQIDHKDGNGLNNQKSNLRICTHQQNQMNRKSYIGRSKYKGVSICKNGRISATIKVNGKNKHLGVFESEIEAAMFYDEAAKKYYGEYANLNFLQSATPDKAEATKCKHENWVWVQKLKQCSDCGYTWFDKAEGETPSECKECRHQNSENCNTCDIINPQFR